MKARGMAEVAEKLEMKNFDKPDEVREFANGRLEMVKIGDNMVARAKLEPGWVWAEDVGPLFKMDTCEAGHFMYCISGVMGIRMDDGKEFECRAGDVCLIPPGHKAWVKGDEPVEVVDFQGMDLYAESK